MGPKGTSKGRRDRERRGEGEGLGERERQRGEGKTTRLGAGREGEGQADRAATRRGAAATHPRQVSVAPGDLQLATPGTHRHTGPGGLVGAQSWQVRLEIRPHRRAGAGEGIT